MIELRVLGPVEVRVGDEYLSGSDRQMAVLAMLVMAHGRVVSADRLVDQLWQGRPPPSAAGSLQAYISRLRRLLEPDRPPRAEPKILVSEANGYALRPGDDAVDAWTLEAVLDAVPTMPPERSLALLQQRLAAWRGTPYEQFADEEWARPEIVRLEELRCSAQERMVEARLRAGRLQEAVMAAKALTEAQPLRGEGSRLLAVSLWLANRSADALDALRDHRRHLAEELGLAPEPRLVVLEQAIREQRPEVLAEAGFAADDVALEALRAPHPLKPAGHVRPAQLPRPSASFNGRESQMRQLTAQADAGDGTVLAVIKGPGGVGKTTLALRWAHQMAARYSDGQLYADLRGFGPENAPEEPGEILAGFLSALGVPDQRIPPGLPDRMALYRSLLAGRRMLLVLDNARNAEQVRPLLPGTGGCAVVLTCRGGLTGLVLAEGAKQIRLDAFGDDDARAYLAARLGAAAVDADPAARDAIVARCGGLPLALAVVAARGARFPLSAVAAELADDGLDAFVVPGMEHDLRAIFSWSYRHLPPDAAALFRRLALHPGPDVTLAAATAVAGGDRAGTRRLLRSLCDEQLLTERLPGRFAYHDLLRAYARELAGHLDSEDSRRSVLVRLAEHHLYSAAAATNVYYQRESVLDDAPESAEQVGFADGDEKAALSWLEREYANIMAVADASPGFAHYFAWALAVFQQDVHLLVDDSIRLCETGIRHAEQDGDRWWISYLNYLIGRAHVRAHRPDEGRGQVERSIEVARELDDPLRLGQALLTLVVSIYGVGRIPSREQTLQAHPYLMEAREHYRRGDGRLFLEGEANCLNALGWFHYYAAGGKDAAVELIQQSIEIHRELGNPGGGAGTLIDLGRLLQDAGDIEAAAAAFESALELLAGSGPRRIEPLVGLYVCYRESGDEEAAQRVRVEALGQLETAHYPDIERLTAILGAA